MCQTEGGAVIKSYLLIMMTIIFTALPVHLAAQEQKGPKSRADELLQYDKPAEALPLYQSALAQNPQDPEIYRNLGYVYELLGSPEKAVEIYQKGAAVASLDRDYFYNAMGRSFFKLERYQEALDQYDKALQQNPVNYAIYVNRANARVELRQYEKAVSDYSTYLSLEPRPEQEPAIRKMIEVLNSLIEAEKNRALAEDARQKEEAARQQALLDSVLSSLEDVTEDTQSLSAGTENIVEPDIEMDLAE